MRVLIVEDDVDVATNIAEYLEPRGCRLDFAYDGVSGLHRASSEAFDAVVLDVMLPGIDGLTLCRRLRADARSSVPILMLTARDALPDRIEGFEAGTDDYLVKPFALDELYHRLKALVRRGGGQVADAVLRVEDLELDTATLEVRRAGRAIRLGRLDLRILTVLLRASPAVVTRERLRAEVWEGAIVSADVIRAHIYQLRRAIDRPHAVALLHTVHGQGYALRRA